LKNTISNFTIYIKFKQNSFRYQNYNVFYYKNEDVWDSFYYTDSEWPKNFLLMNQSRSSNISGYADSAIVIAYMNFEDVAQWSHTTLGKRGHKYLNFKKRKAEKLLQELELCCPGINNCIETFYTSSPLTYRDYTGTTDGSMYGVMRDCSMSSQIMVTQKTKIPNLFFTGQNINAHGMLGVAVGSILTCSELIGSEKLISQLRRFS
jgi:all-trans-retinol 13,14-reductase